MTRALALAAIVLTAVVGTAAAERQAATPTLVGMWELVVEGKGPFAGASLLELKVGETRYSPIGLPLSTVSGTLTIGTTKFEIQGTVDQGGALMFSVPDGWFGGGVKDGEILGTHVYTVDGTGFKTGWRGKRPAK